MNDLIFTIGAAYGSIITLIIEIAVLAITVGIMAFIERRTTQMAAMAKEYLQQYRESLDRTRELTAHLDELKAECIQLRDHEGNRKALDDAVAKYMDACESAASELNRLAALRGEINGTIDAIPDARLRTLLRERYINGKKWEQIAVDMNFEYRWVLRLHGRALEEVKQAIESHI